MGLLERHLRRSPRVVAGVLGLDARARSGPAPARPRARSRERPGAPRPSRGDDRVRSPVVRRAPDRRRPAVRDDRRDPTRAVPAPRARAPVLDRLRGRRACSRPARRQGGLLPVPGLPGRMGRIAVDRPHPLPRRARLARRDGGGAGDAVGGADEAGSYGASCCGTGSSVTPNGVIVASRHLRVALPRPDRPRAA